MEQRVIDKLRRNSKTRKKVDLAKGQIGRRKGRTNWGAEVDQKGKQKGGVGPGGQLIFTTPTFYCTVGKSMKF